MPWERSFSVQEFFHWVFPCKIFFLSKSVCRIFFHEITHSAPRPTHPPQKSNGQPVRACCVRNPGNFYLLNSEYSKILLWYLESRALESRIQVPLSTEELGIHSLEGTASYCRGTRIEKKKKANRPNPPGATCRNLPFSQTNPLVPGYIVDKHIFLDLGPSWN